MALSAQLEWRDLLRELFTKRFDLFLAVLMLLFGIVAAILIVRLIRRLLVALDVPAVVEGTPFERSAQRIGTSTVSLLAWLSGAFILLVATIAALRVLGILAQELFATRIATYLPQIFAATIILIVGIILGDKVEVAISERLRSVKLPEIGVLPSLVKYTVIFIAVLVALGQLGVFITPLLVVLAAIVFGAVILAALAFGDLLASSAAGVYVLLNEPYAIGDEVEIDGKRGIVQEIDVLVTRIESDSEEFVIPNQQVFRSGVTRIRE